jgi:hypothetical protein
MAAKKSRGRKRESHNPCRPIDIEEQGAEEQIPAAVGPDENVNDQLQPATLNEEEELTDDGLTHHWDVAGELTEVQDHVTGDIKLISEEEPAAEWSPDALDLEEWVDETITLARVITDGYSDRG